MINIYSLLSHRSLTEEEVASTQVGNSLTKGQKILVLQAHLLSTLQI